jgi:hypothetical protein
MDSREHLPTPVAAVTTTTDSAVAAAKGPYITHEQARRLYGDQGSVFHPTSLLGALFKLKSELMHVIVPLGGGKATDSQLDRDYSDVARLQTALCELLDHAKEGGLYFTEERNGLKKILGKKLIPIGEATALLPKEQNSLVSKNGEPKGNIAPFLETERFVGLVYTAFEIANRYKKDLGEEKYNALVRKVRSALAASGLSEGIAGLLPPATAREDGSAVKLINDDPNAPQRGR